MENKREYVLSKQLLQGGTCGIKKDFLHKMNIALKEANGSGYWLELLRDGDFISKETSETSLIQTSEPIKILVRIVKTKRIGLKR